MSTRARSSRVDSDLAPHAEPTREVRAFGTTTRESAALADWLAATDVGHHGAGISRPRTGSIAY
jgi:hypothetical protein